MWTFVLMLVGIYLFSLFIGRLFWFEEKLKTNSGSGETITVDSYAADGESSGRELLHPFWITSE